MTYAEEHPRGAEAERSGPLSGVRVLEIGMFIAGPFAGQQLGDLGADVVKVEHPEGGDPMRHWRDLGPGDLWWPSLSRNKRGLTLDIATPQGVDILRRLVRRCNILVENFRPGTLERWGLGPDVLHHENPALVIVRVSGFGQDGPYASRAGFGSVGEAMGGLRHLTGWPDRPSTRTGISLGDQIASLFATIGALAALRHAERTGEGQVVDTAIYESVFAFMESLVAEYELLGRRRERTGPILPGVAPSNVYETADSVEILIAGNSDPIFRRLVEALGLEPLADDPRFKIHTERAKHHETLDALLSERIVQYDADELLDILEAANVPAGRVYTAADMVTDSHYAAREMIRRFSLDGIGALAMPAPVPRFSRSPSEIRRVGLRLGQHTDEVLAELANVDPDELDELRARKIV